MTSNQALEQKYLLFNLLVFTFLGSSTCLLDLEERRLVSQQITLANAFPGCLVQVISISDTWLDFTQLFEPIIILRYTPDPNNDNIYPNEYFNKWLN